MRRLLIVVLLTGILQRGFSQVQYVAFRIDSAIRATMEARRIPGMQVTVIKYGLVIKKGNYGFANLEDRMPVTDSTMFAIASISKAFTCAGVLLLMEDGKLSLDDSIAKFLDLLPASWKNITVRQLMNHTSGLGNDWNTGDDNFFYTSKTDSAFLAESKKSPLPFSPGHAFRYSDGPFILGLIISRVSGESYPDFMRERIFDKLGMKNTCINDADSIIHNRAAGYILQDSTIKHGRNISAAAQARGDVGILTTVTDMLKWYAALQDSSLLKSTSIELMFSPGILRDGSKTSYGLGWFLAPYRDHALITHEGALRTGYNADIEIFPEDHVCIVILSNLLTAQTNLIARDIIGLFDPLYGRSSQMIRDSVDPDSVHTLLLKSDFTELGLNLDTTRKLIREMHISYYPESDSDLNMFRNVTEFNFIKAIRPTKPRADIFGDLIQGIYLYEVKCKNQPTRYFAFLTDPAGKLVYLDYEE
jgi:CubicO group peptidase (beta-lactamase class C family)